MGCFLKTSYQVLIVGQSQLTSSVQVQAAQVLVLFDSLVQKQERLVVKASAEALDSEVVVGESQLELHLLQDRAALLSLLLLRLAELSSQDQILDGRDKLLQTSVQSPSGGRQADSNTNENKDVFTP